MLTRAPFQPLQGLPLSTTDRAFGVFATRGWLAARKHRPTLPTLLSLVSRSIAAFHLDAVLSGNFMTGLNRAQVVD